MSLAIDPERSPAINFPESPVSGCRTRSAPFLDGIQATIVRKIVLEEFVH